MIKIKKINFEEQKSFEILMAFKKYRELRNNYEKLIEEFTKITGFATDADRRNKMLEAEKVRLENEIKKLKSELKKHIEPKKLTPKEKNNLTEEMPKIPKESKCKKKKSSSKNA